MSMREERRVVTAVFADLVGSTALGERLDPEELKLVVGEAVSRMVVAVEAFDGHVKDLAGDGVLAIFGAPTSHEDDADRAVRAISSTIRRPARAGRVRLHVGGRVHGPRARDMDRLARGLVEG